MVHQLEREGAHLIVRVQGRLDAQSAPVLQGDMANELEGVTSILFDLEDLEYVSSAGLRVLLASYKLMMKCEGTMQIVNIDERVMSVLDASGFAALFGVDADSAS